MGEKSEKSGCRAAICSGSENVGDVLVVADDGDVLG